MSGTTVYAGGYFTSVNGQPRSHLAAFDTTTGALKPWNPSVNKTVDDLAVRGNMIYVGGYFTSVSGDYRHPITSQATPAGVDGTTATQVSATVRGLQPGGLYFYRLVTLTGLGVTASEERAFITPGWRVMLPVNAALYATMPPGPRQTIAHFREGVQSDDNDK